MRITVVGAVLIVAGVIVLFLVLEALNNLNNGHTGTQTPQGKQPNGRPPGA